MSNTPAMFRALTRYAEFNGRSNRAEFWWFLLGIYVIEGLLYGGLYLSSLKNGQFDLETFLPHYMQFSPLVSLFGMAILVPILAVTVRRLHDINRSGWWIVAPMVVSMVAYVVFFMVKGEELFNLMLNMGQQMQNLETNNPSALMNPMTSMTTVLKLEWPLFRLILPWVFIPSLCAQLVFYIFLALPGTTGDNRFGGAPVKG